MPTFQMFYQIDVKNKDGKVLRSSGVQESHSFVKNFLNWMRSIYFGWSEGCTFTDVDNVTVTNDQNGNWAQLDDSLYANYNQLYGILIGSGSTAVTNDDYAITLIDTSIMAYGITSMFQPYIQSGNVDFLIQREFYNPNTEDSVTINEIGLFITGSFQINGNGYTNTLYMLSRDVVTATTANPGEYISVTYTLRTTA
jgi:hypothetical protein